jgi:serine/threonine protein kinase
MSDLEIGMIGKYELLREIGSGSMAHVYLARDPFVDIEVAIKIADTVHNDSERGARRRSKLFLNEVKASGMLRHPNIIATYDAGVDGVRHFIVMEYVSGARTIDDYCHKPNLLKPGEAVSLIQECAVAFDYAHSKGIVHRDIKPKNIMLNDNNMIKIGDFGIALIDRSDIEQTQVVGRLGSPRYMAPEQLIGDTVTNQSDIFSLGVVLYELLSGISPFASNSVAEIARRILKDPHTPVLELNPEIPSWLSAIVDRCLSKHPAGRYKTAMELAGELSLVCDDLDMTGSKRTGQDVIRLLESIPGFYGFAPDELAELLSVADWDEVSAGECILSEGSGDGNAVVLIKGEAEVKCGGVRVTRLAPGSSCGDFSLVESGPPGGDIVALNQCTVLRFSASQAERLSVECRQRLYRVLAGNYAGRLQQLQRRISRQAAKKSKQ